MINKDDLVGLILSGGKSRRMGSDKALLETGKGSYLQKSASLLKTYCGEVYISSGNEMHDLTDTQRIPDVFPSEGPLTGIISAMQTVESAYWLVLAVDLPYIHPLVIEFLIQGAAHDRITAYSIQGNPEPLCAIYPRVLFGEMLEYYQKGNRRLMELLWSLDYCNLPAESYPELNIASSLRNVNSVDDL